MLDVLAVHGVATSRANMPELEARWRDALGKGWRLRCARWESSGLASADLIRVVSGKEFRERQVGLVRSAIEAWLRVRIVGARKVIVGFSLGQALAATALEGIAEPVPLVGIGGPLGQPVFGRVLRAIGLGAAQPKACAWDVWNADDAVSSIGGLQGPEHTPLPGWHMVRVGDAGPNPGLFGEHRDAMYLAHQAVQSILRAIEEDAPWTLRPSLPA